MLPILLFYYATILQGNVSPTQIKDYIVTESLVIGVDPQIALGIAKEESGFNPDNIGDHGTSHGLWQIHLPDHKDISKEQAHDIVFSTEWALKEMKKNGCKIWSTCKQVMKEINQNSS
jgi:hypothetical protein